MTVTDSNQKFTIDSWMSAYLDDEISGQRLDEIWQDLNEDEKAQTVHWLNQAALTKQALDPTTPTNLLGINVLDSVMAQVKVTPMEEQGQGIKLETASKPKLSFQQLPWWLVSLTSGLLAFSVLIVVDPSSNISSDQLVNNPVDFELGIEDDDKEVLVLSQLDQSFEDAVLVNLEDPSQVTPLQDLDPEMIRLMNKHYLYERTESGDSIEVQTIQADFSKETK